MDKQDNQFTINALNANQRFDKFLLKYMNKASKSFIYKMLRKKRIKLNGTKAEGNELLSDGDVITFYIAPETMESLFEHRPAVGVRIEHRLQPSQIIFEDENILIANKPSGLLVHAEKIGDDTLIDRVIHYLQEKSEYDPVQQGSFAPVCANRLDRNTSGIVACAKNLPAAQALAEAFRERNTAKYYMAVVYGVISKKVIVHNYLSKDSANNKVETFKELLDGAKEALTEIEPLSHGENYTIVKIRLHTGRTHQIRAHLQSIGHSIIGDPKYGNKTANDFYRKKHSIHSQLLHATELTIINSGFLAYLSGKTFSAPLPPLFNIFI